MDGLEPSKFNNSLSANVSMTCRLNNLDQSLVQPIIFRSWDVCLQRRIKPYPHTHTDTHTHTNGGCSDCVKDKVPPIKYQRPDDCLSLGTVL